MIEPGKQELTRVIEARAILGYTVESLTDTRAVLVVSGRKRFFGMRDGGERTDSKREQHAFHGRVLPARRDGQTG